MVRKEDEYMSPEVVISLCEVRIKEHEQIIKEWKSKLAWWKKKLNNQGTQEKHEP
jgi:hypothetical protein